MCLRRRNRPMEEARQVCSECGAIWHEEQTYQDSFHQMLFWEHENPRDGSEVHHLMVLCYHQRRPAEAPGFIHGEEAVLPFLGQGHEWYLWVVICFHFFDTPLKIYYT